MTTNIAELNTTIYELSTEELEAIQGGGSTILYKAPLDPRLAGASNEERRPGSQTVFA